MKSFRSKNVALLLACALSGQGGLLAETGAGEPPKLVLEPLSLTVSKLDRDTFGKGVNPFQVYSGDAVSGISLLVKVTPDPSFKARLVKSGAKLLSFRDDKGADLLSPAQGRQLDSFWPANQSLNVVQSPTGDTFGLQLRTPKTPSASATKLETGLGTFEGGGRNANPKRGFGRDPGAVPNPAPRGPAKPPPADPPLRID